MPPYFCLPSNLVLPVIDYVNMLAVDGLLMPGLVVGSSHSGCHRDHLDFLNGFASSILRDVQLLPAEVLSQWQAPCCMRQGHGTVAEVVKPLSVLAPCFLFHGGR